MSGANRSGSRACELSLTNAISGAEHTLTKLTARAHGLTLTDNDLRRHTDGQIHADQADLTLTSAQAGALDLGRVAQGKSRDDFCWDFGA